MQQGKKSHATKATVCEQGFGKQTKLNKENVQFIFKSRIPLMHVSLEG